MSRIYLCLLPFDTFFGQRNRRGLVARFQCARLPVIQLVGNAMTVAALREAGHHTGRVRHSMTTLAGWYRFVFVLMAGNT